MNINKKLVMYASVVISTLLMVFGLIIAIFVAAQMGMYMVVAGLAAGTLVLFIAGDKKPTK